ncbi:MAG: DUF2206 domain-containing protein [Nocardioides sp.]
MTGPNLSSISLPRGLRVGKGSAGPGDQQGEQRRPTARRHRSGRRTTLEVALLLICWGAVAFDIDLAAPRAAAGLILVLIAPMALLATRGRWHTSSAWERWLYALVVTIAALLTVATAVDQTLFAIGVERPLSEPILATTALLANLVLIRRLPRTGPARRLGRPDAPTQVALAAVGVAVVGAVRLNNGAGSLAATAGLVLALGVMAMLILRSRATPDTDATALYFVSLALLLGTSLRSWYISGHDIQREAFVFGTTLAERHWDPLGLADAYNACLSITVLPTVLAVVSGLPGTGIFKVLFPAALAAMPVAVYLTSRRFVSRRTAVLGVAMLIGFPTFVIDMPMLNRQAMAFLFLAMMLMSATQAQWTPRRRRMFAYVFGVGVIVSHYSTVYVLILTMAIGLAAWTLVRLARRLTKVLGRSRPAEPETATTDATPVILSVGLTAFMILGAWSWSTYVTNTDGFARDTLSATLGEVLGDTERVGSSDARYIPFTQDPVSAQERLDTLYDDTLARTEETRAAGELLPLTEDARRLEVSPRRDLPVQPVGRVLEAVGIDPGEVNLQLRAWSARLLQIFLIVGLLAALVRHRRTRALTPELRFLAIGALVSMALISLIPGLSVSYGLLRLFQQNLIIVAPLLAIGLLTATRVFGRASRWVAGAIVLVMFASLTGLLPQLLGGYPPQLNTSNAGDYYDRYYVTEHEPDALAWLKNSGAPVSDDRPLVSDLYTFARLTNQGITSFPTTDEILPAQVRPGRYFLLGRPTVLDSQATVPYAGDQVTFDYPTEMLDDNLSRVYDSGSARVYR